MKYGDLTQEQRDIRNHYWEQLLHQFCNPLDNEGTRYCDMGSVCDRCYYDHDLNLAFVQALHEDDQPLLEEEVRKFKGIAFI